MPLTLYQRYMNALQLLGEHISRCPPCQSDQRCEDRDLLEKGHYRLRDLLAERAHGRRDPGAT